jgi:hypothetical protein
MRGCPADDRGFGSGALCGLLWPDPTRTVDRVLAAPEDGHEPSCPW